MMNKMNALRLFPPQPIDLYPLRVESVAISTPNENEVLVKIHTCGICRTDLPIIEGELSQKRTPLIPGRAVVGKVEKIARNVIMHKRGSRVCIY